MDQDQYDRAFGMLKTPKETERRIHKRLCTYLRVQYPKARFISTLDGEKFDMYQAQAVRALQWRRGAPDLLIFAYRKPYTGLALEIKLTTVFKKDGSLRKNEHVEEQADWLDYLKDEGWDAKFGIGFDQCKSIVDNYLRK